MSGTKAGCSRSCVPECPGGWEQLDRRCYLFGNSSLTWSKAEEYCKSGGGHLASVTSEKINKFLAQLLDNRNTKDIWIGATDQGVEGTFAWSDCSRWGFTSWEDNQPNDLNNNEDCAELNIGRQSASWNDLPCESDKKFVCAKEICPGNRV